MAGKYYIIATLSFLIAKYTFGEDVNYGLTNGNITLKANIRGIPEEILWKWNGNKVLEVDKISSEVYMQFEGRAYVNVSTGDLTITGLTEGDSGDYKAEVQVEKKLQYSQHRVEVIDPVADPIVTCERSGSAVTLICASDLSLSTTYSWEGLNMAMPASGSELHLEITESRDSVYTCVVKNPVSELRANFTLQHCFTARGVVTNLVIAIAVLFFVFLGALGIWFYYKKYKVTASQQARCEMGDRENELVHDKNNPDKGSLKNQEDDSNSILPFISLPGQGGVGNEQEEAASGTGNEEDKSLTRQESTNKAGAQEEEKVKEGVAKCQGGNLPKPPRKTPVPSMGQSR